MAELSLDELEQLAAVATPPPWEPEGDELWAHVGPYSDKGGFSRSEDAAFACAARTAIPDLIGEVRRLRCVLVEAEQRAKRFQVLFDGGPETSCRTVWDDDGVECVSVPLADVRWAFGDSDG